MGYGYIATLDAERIQRFYSEYFHPYLNFHRPCAQADIEIDGKRKATPSLPPLPDTVGNAAGPS